MARSVRKEPPGLLAYGSFTSKGPEVGGDSSWIGLGRDLFPADSIATRKVSFPKPGDQAARIIGKM